MPHFKVDDMMHMHPKARRAGLDAVGLWTMAGSWSMAYKQDGFVPGWYVAGWPRGPKLAALLVTAGLWEMSEKDGDLGWRFHDWHDVQMSAEEIERDREHSRERQRRYREKMRKARAGNGDQP